MFIWCHSVFCFFFFKQKTAYEMRISDWSSDVCSSDLGGGGAIAALSRCLWRRYWVSLAAGHGHRQDRLQPRRLRQDRKSVVSGKSVSVRVDLGGRRIIKKKTYTQNKCTTTTRQM